MYIASFIYIYILHHFYIYIYCIIFIYIYIASFLHTYSSFHKKGHITGYVGLKLKTIQCCNPSKYFCPRAIVLNTAGDQISPG